MGLMLFTIIGIIVALIATVIGLFFGNIILFDSIAFGLIAGSLANQYLPIHPAFAFLIGLGVFILLMLLQQTKFGFWIIASIMSLTWGVLLGVLIAEILYPGDMTWKYVLWGVVGVVVFLLHLRARENYA